MLQLKRIWNRGAAQYQQVAGEEDLEAKGYPHPPGLSPFGEEEREPLFEDEPGRSSVHLPIKPRKRNTRRAICGLLSKVVLGLLVAIGIWSVIEFFLLPIVDDGDVSFDTFGASLQCQSTAKYFWNDRTENIVRVKPGLRGEHAFDTHGDSVGTITITAGKEGATDVEYTFSIRGEEKDVVDKVFVEYPSLEEAEFEMSRMSISTLKSMSITSCTRFDVVIAVPPGMKKLHVASHVATHIRFDPEATLALEDLYVTLYAMDTRNLLIPHERFVVSDKMALEVYRGKIAGEISVGGHASIKTQRGDGAVDVKVLPAPPANARTPEPAFFQTTTGFGPTKVVYVDDETSAHRPIRARHISSRKGPLDLSYEDAAFNGRVEMGADSTQLTGDNVHAFPAGGSEWSHFVGSEGGVDEIHINSRGRVSLGF